MFSAARDFRSSSVEFLGLETEALVLLLVVGRVRVAVAVVGALVDELLGWSLWKKLVIVLVLGLRGVFFLVFPVLFVGFVASWRRSRVGMLSWMDGAKMYESEVVVCCVWWKWDVVGSWNACVRWSCWRL